jgi:alpha-beta hydrolase superfamily lysophospholipase
MSAVATFVLLHGAWHGAWCWPRLVDELAALGHHGVAMDLPSEDPAAGLAAYVEVAVAAVHADPQVTPDEPTIVLGHSLTGIVAPLVAARLGAARVVYLCAFVPTAKSSFDDQVVAESGRMFAPRWRELSSRQETDSTGGSWWQPADAIEAMYHDCPDDVATDAAARLRPQHWELCHEPNPTSGPTARPGTFVLTTDDRVFDASWARAVARERLGSEAIELPGGHSPMLSRPADLAAVLDRLA